MTETVQLLGVCLTVDSPKINLWRGQVGTVVEVLSGSSAFEVELCDRDGRTYASLRLRPDLMVLRHAPESATSGAHP
jgi:hypothetical protein